MTLFKINGERNSGTTFLARILQVNKFPVYEHHFDNENKIVYHWKHRVPTDDYKELDSQVVDIFIFRNLKEWLVSMSQNMYHLESEKITQENFKEFLVKTNKTSVKDFKDYRSRKIANIEDNGKNVFEIRYYKFNGIMDYKNRNKNIVFVNLEYLQNQDNLLDFLKQLDENYLQRNNNNYITNIAHTKDKKGLNNRKYDINIDCFEKMIQNSKNNFIEEYIKNLDFEIFNKTNL